MSEDFEMRHLENQNAVLASSNSALRSELAALKAEIERQKKLNPFEKMNVVLSREDYADKEAELAALKAENEALKANDVVAAPYRHLACKAKIDEMVAKLASHEQERAPLLERLGAAQMDLSREMVKRQDAETRIKSLEARLAAAEIETFYRVLETFNKCGCWNGCAGCKTVKPLISEMLGAALAKKTLASLQSEPAREDGA